MLVTTKDNEKRLNIQFKYSTRDKLLEIGKKKETYDDVVSRLIKERHIKLLKCLDEVIWDYLQHHEDKTGSNTTLTELIDWSNQQKKK